MKWEDLLNEFLDKLDTANPNIPEEDKKRCREWMVNIFVNQMKPKEAIGLSDEMVENMYNYGYRLYNLGNFKQASLVFTALVDLDPTDKRYPNALGASYHQMKQYHRAVEQYASVAKLDMDDPVPFYYLYDCYYKTGLLTDALICLKETIKRCGQVPMYEKIKGKSELMLSNLAKEILDMYEKDLLTNREELEKVTEKPEVQAALKELKELAVKSEHTVEAKLKT